DRAYMIFDGYEVEKCILPYSKNSKEIYDFKMTWTNLGLSPALNVRTYAALSQIPGSLSSLEKLKSILERNAINVGVNRSESTSIGFPTADVKKYASDLAVLYAACLYEDTHGKTYIDEFTAVIMEEGCNSEEDNEFKVILV